MPDDARLTFWCGCQTIIGTYESDRMPLDGGKRILTCHKCGASYELSVRLRCLSGPKEKSVT